MNSNIYRFRALALLAVSATVTLSFASGSMTGDYYVLSENHIDANENINGVVHGLVKNQLDPIKGLPVTNVTGTAMNSGVLKDVDAMTGDLLWWSAGTRTALRRTFSVTHEKTELDSTPLNFTSNFFPTGNTNDKTGFL